MKRLALAAVLAAGLHLLLFRLDVDRSRIRGVRPAPVGAVTIALTLAPPRVEEPRGLAPPPDAVLLPPPEKRSGGATALQDPPARAIAPKPATGADGRAPTSKPERKPAPPAPSQPATGPLEPRAAGPPGRPESVSAPGKSETEEVGRLFAPQAEGRPGDAPAPPLAHGQPAQAPPALQEATPEYDRNPPPEYPRRARQLGIEGTVVLEVRVNPTGGVGEVKIAASSGNSLLDQSALRSVRTWRFKPARRGDLPVAAWVQVPIRYTLEPSGGSLP